MDETEVLFLHQQLELSQGLYEVACVGSGTGTRRREEGGVGARSEGESDVETRSGVESRCGKDKRERACMV